MALFFICQGILRLFLLLCFYLWNEIIIKKHSMNRFRVIVLLIAAALIYACSTSNESRIPGKWVADEVEITPKTENFSKAKEDALRRLEKTVTFIFEEDMTMKAVTGSTAIDGVWTFDEETSEIFVAFIGDNDPKPKQFGIFKNGRLITSRDSDDVDVRTTYKRKE
jgi:hypothetical protein